MILSSANFPAALAIAALALLNAGVASAQSNALGGFSNSATNTLQTAADAVQCRQNLKRIYAAIQAYRADKKQLPNWLSDLVPQYLDDVNVLTCPVTRRTGRINNYGLQDPKLPTSYLYEFCNAS